MNEYATIYTQLGLKTMIDECNLKISILKLERANVGKTWTKVKINSHIKTIDQEIADLEGDIEELQKALEYRRQNGLQ